MNVVIIEKLTCPVDKGDPLKVKILRGSDDDVIDAIVWNSRSGNWYFVENRLLDLLPPAFSYEADRKEFYKLYQDEFASLKLEFEWNTTLEDKNKSAVLEQQEHFDEYSSSDVQTYTEYENSPFWKAADEITFDRWISLIKKRSNGRQLLVDIGSAQGRSCQYFHDLDLDIVGVDVSKKCLAEAVKRYTEEPTKANYHFIVADCSSFPIKDESVDYVLIYGVLHHLPDPGKACIDIIRILKKDGLYLGSENHKSCLRFMFDLLMLLKPQWYEKAGAEPLISQKDYNQWLPEELMSKHFVFSIYLPPHLINILGHKYGRSLLRVSDHLLSKMAFFNITAGLITLVGIKR